MFPRGHSYLRALRLLVACAVWVFCHGQPSLPRAADPIALVVTVAAAVHTVAQQPVEVRAEAPAPRPDRQQRAQRPAARPSLPPAPVAVAKAAPDTGPALPLYLRNCSLLC